jgi:hypothetical protein
LDVSEDNITMTKVERRRGMAMNKNFVAIVMKKEKCSWWFKKEEFMCIRSCSCCTQEVKGCVFALLFIGIYIGL